MSSRDADRLADATAAYDLGEDMYAVRSAVIAHASIQTTGNLFSNIVPPFGELAARATCGGIAIRASLPLQDILHTAHVGS